MIIADTREPEEIAKKCDKVALLEYGDYLITDENNPDRRILVERKTTTDFLNSLFDERLFLQLESVDILICEKTYVPSSILRRMGGYLRLQDFINSITIHTPVLQTSGQEHTINTLRRLEKRLKLGEYGTMRHPIMIKPKSESPAVRVLMGFDGIGEEWATTLLKHYGSLRNVLANVENWDEIKRFGKKKKLDAIKVLDEKW